MFDRNPNAFDEEELQRLEIIGKEAFTVTADFDHEPTPREVEILTTQELFERLEETKFITRDDLGRAVTLMPYSLYVSSVYLGNGSYQAVVRVIPGHQVTNSLH